MRDLYYILGVAKNATPAEIDNAYRVLSDKLRPSSGETDYFLQNHFNEITDAYAMLSNPAKRKTYDAALKRNQLRQLSRFKAKTANGLIAVSIMLLTGLIGFYLVNLINSHKATQKIVTVDSTAVVQAPKKHHKKKRHSKTFIAKIHSPVAAHKAFIKPETKPTLAVVKPKVDTVKKQLPKTVYAAAKPVFVKKDTVKSVKPLIAQAPIKHLILVKSTTQRDSSYITYLKNNLRDSVYMHQLADYMSPVVSVLSANAKVRVLEKGKTFYKVAFTNETGYIPKWSLAKP